MIHLLFSNHTERLLSLLAEDLGHFRERRGPWEPAHLVLPNPGVRQFVQSGLAYSELKVVANLQMNYLEGFWRRFLPPGVRLLDRTALQGLLLGLLQDGEFLAQAELGPVRAYLMGEPLGLKALQFSGALARLFESYLLGRPKWMQAWEAGRAVAEGAPPALEAWQRCLWQGVRGRLAALPDRWLTLPEYFADPLFDRAPFPQEVFLFGPGPMALAYHQAFHRLGQRSDDFNVHLYVHNPCQEEWSDLRRTWGADTSEDPFSEDTQAPLALQRWGKPGREHVCQLCELVDWNQDMESVETEGSGLLQGLQDEILTLRASRTLEADPSLRILACASPRREAEAVADEIWETLKGAQPLGSNNMNIDAVPRHKEPQNNNPHHPGHYCAAPKGQIRFSEMAVVLPESVKTDYLEALRVAFAGAREIPWRLADEGPDRVRELVEGALLLLRLGMGDLNRAAVLRVLSHPAFLRRWPDLALEGLPEFCDRAGIVARLDARETEGTYLEGGLWTWERGLQRAALGAFLGGEGAVALGDHALPAAAPQEGSADLVLMLHALLGDVRHLRELHQRPAAWVLTLRTLLQAYLGPQGDEGDQRAMAELSKALERLGGLEVPGVPLPLLGGREAIAFVEEALQRLTQEPLGPYGRGVVVASHAALRGIPFKAIFCLGMGEGVFPGGDSQDPLDLKTFKRQPGDVSRADQDRYLFLETLTSARERLVLSYTCRDPLSGEELQPSPLILDLRDLLRPGLGEAGWQALWVRHPLHRHDPAYFQGGLPASHNPEARAEFEALTLGQGLRVAAGRAELPEDLRQWSLPTGVHRELLFRMGSCGPLGAGAGEIGERIHIRAGDLRKWLECQIQGGARLRLGLRGEPGEDPAELLEEPFSVDFLTQRGLVREVFWGSLESPNLNEGDRPLAMLALHPPPAPNVNVEELYEERIWALREAARIPAGVLGEGDRRKALAQIQGWRGLLGASVQPISHRFGPDRSGRASTQALAAHPPITWTQELGGRTVTVILEGQTEPQWEGGSLLLSSRKPPKDAPEAPDRKDLLRAWFDQLLLAASGLQAGGHRAKVLSWQSDKEQAPWHVELPPVDQAGAQGRLGAWLREALLEPRWTLMPIEGVLAEWGKEEPDLEDWLEKQQSSDRASFSSLYGPLNGLLEAEVEPQWQALAQARYGDFLDWSSVRGEGL